jgi:hypothetical protein
MRKSGGPDLRGNDAISAKLASLIEIASLRSQ